MTGVLGTLQVHKLQWINFVFIENKNWSLRHFPIEPLPSGLIFLSRFLFARNLLINTTLDSYCVHWVLGNYNCSICFLFSIAGVHWAWWAVCIAECIEAFIGRFRPTCLLLSGIYIQLAWNRLKNYTHFLFLLILLSTQYTSRPVSVFWFASSWKIHISLWYYRQLSCSRFSHWICSPVSSRARFFSHSISCSSSIVSWSSKSSSDLNFWSSSCTSHSSESGVDMCDQLLCDFGRRPHFTLWGNRSWRLPCLLLLTDPGPFFWFNVCREFNLVVDVRRDISEVDALSSLSLE